MPTQQEELFNLFDDVNNIIATDDKRGMPPIPEAVSGFLGKLSLLEGVPIHNLIINEQFLPLKIDNGKETGSFKFFWVDPEWIECLLNGALSLADEQDEMMLQNAMDGKYTAKVVYDQAIEKVKSQIKGLEPEVFKDQLIKRLKSNNNITYGDPKPTPAQSDWEYTGFFIRSSIISSWTGVEIIAYGTNSISEEKALQVIRLERIAYDIIYCICEGIITRIEIIQPPETIHFETTALTAVGMFRDRDEKTLDIKALAKLPNKGVVDPQLKSATLAAILLSTPFKTSLTINR